MPKFFLFPFCFQLDNEPFFLHCFKLTFPFPLEINNPDRTCFPCPMHNVQLFQHSPAASGELEKLIHSPQGIFRCWKWMGGGKRKPKDDLRESGLFQRLIPVRNVWVAPRASWWQRQHPRFAQDPLSSQLSHIQGQDGQTGWTDRMDRTTAAAQSLQENSS